MKNNRLVLPMVFITLLILIVLPVQGYTLLNDYTLPRSSGAVSEQILIFDSRVNQTNITKVEIETECMPLIPLYTSHQEIIGSLRDGGAVIRYDNITFDLVSGGLYQWSICSITHELAGINTETSQTQLNINYYGNNSKVFNENYIKFNKTTTTAPKPYASGYNLSGYQQGHYKIYNGTGVPVAPIADFTGTPLVGTVPLLVSLTDNSTGTAPLTYNWSGSGPADSMFWTSLTNQNTTVYLNKAGNYTISLTVSNSMGDDTETKTDYIWLYDDNSTSTTGCLAVAGPTGQRIGGAQVDMYDIENSSWSNTTTTDGLGMITTLKGHTISCYGTATGFSPGDLLNQPEKDRQVYTLNLWPSAGYRNVSPGYVTLYITVTDLDTGAPIAGAAIYGGGNNYGVLVNSSAFSLTTNVQGMASVPVQNNSVVYLTTSKAGYNTQTSAVNTGTGSGGDAKVTHWIKLSKGTITPTATMTTLPGGGYPTATATVVTVDPYPCDADHPENCERKQTDMANIVIQYGPMLVSLFICATIFGTVKMMGLK